MVLQRLRSRLLDSLCPQKLRKTERLRKLVKLGVHQDVMSYLDDKEAAGRVGAERWPQLFRKQRW